MTNKLVGSVVDIITQVNEIITPAYLVGGSVRDALLGKQPHDYDFSTPLLPDEIENKVRQAGRRPYLAGKRFGTVGFKLDNCFIEVTTFRTEIYTAKSRKPTVEFIDDVTHDLSRRDFTINALAARVDGSLIDPFGGYEDLQSHLIRTVNKAYERYNEDPLRMLRAARFTAQLGFTVDPEAINQATKKAVKILEVSKERWSTELDRLLVADQPDLGLNFLADTRLLNFILPELAIQVGLDQDSPYHELRLWQHTVKTVGLTRNDLNLRWAALLHDIGKPYVRTVNRHGYSNYPDHAVVGAELVKKIGPYLKWSKARQQQTEQLVASHLDANS